MFVLLVGVEKNSMVEDPRMKLLQQWLSCSDNERVRQFMDTRSAAQLAGVSQRTIRFWIESGSIQAFRIADKYHVHKMSLESFIIKRMLQDQ